MIKLGISACFMYPDPQRPVFSHKSLSYLENDMGRYVTKKGILPVLIPDVAQEYFSDILAEMDAFLFQGGNDLAPETYGEKPIGPWKGDAYRDAYELRILDYAIKHSKPVLGICRGLQLMNVYFGGTLFQDTSTQNPKAIDHRSAEKYDTLKHALQLAEGKILERLYGETANPNVNTVHHQSIKELGKDLEVLAWAPDGTIEAFGYKKEPEGKVMAVQWHPEFSPALGNEVIDADILLEAFLEHVKS